MIATIIDIVASRDVTPGNRRMLDKKIRNMLIQTFKQFEKYCDAIPTLTQGDSIELLTHSWKPIVFLFHRLLMEELEFRVGIGTGKIIVHNENADECDGPAFWNARQALDEIRQMKYLSRPAGFSIDENTLSEEKNAVVYSVLFLTALLGLSTAQLQYCFYFIWKKKSISEISETLKTSKPNVSKTLSRTPCNLLKEVMSYLDNC
ncbi:MAG: SatD family protein [Promethearchaeota archaeon]